MFPPFRDQWTPSTTAFAIPRTTSQPTIAPAPLVIPTIRAAAWHRPADRRGLRGLGSSTEAVARATRWVPSGYGYSLAAVAASTVVALTLGLGSEAGAFAPFFVSVVAIALAFGIGPALLTIATSMVAAYIWLLGPMLSLAFDPDALRRLAFFRLGVFAAAGAAIIVITELHRRAPHDLERSRRQLRAFLSNEAVALQVVDHQGQIAWADETTTTLLGGRAAAYVGTPFGRYFTDAGLAKAVLTRIAAGREVENVRAQLLRHDGSICEVLLNSNSFFGDARRDGGVLVAILPIGGLLAGEHAQSSVPRDSAPAC